MAAEDQPNPEKFSLKGDAFSMSPVPFDLDMVDAIESNNTHRKI
eukprot:SAG31_NODE_41549_length_275_cov_1.113636_1_plen_43_part_10